MPLRIVVLISGSGSNLQALIDAKFEDASIVLVISNRKAAYGLVRASQATPPIATSYLGLQPYLKSNPGSTRDDYDAELARVVLGARPDLVVLAGWMHVLGSKFLEPLTRARYAEEGARTRYVPVINLHPALPGAFDGTHSIERAHKAFQDGQVDKVGIMVHRVILEVDRGEPVIVQEVDIHKGESLELFEERVHQTEWKVIVLATQLMLDEIQLFESLLPKLVAMIELSQSLAGLSTPQARQSLLQATNEFKEAINKAKAAANELAGGEIDTSEQDEIIRTLEDLRDRKKYENLYESQLYADDD